MSISGVGSFFKGAVSHPDQIQRRNVAHSNQCKAPPLQSPPISAAPAENQSLTSRVVRYGAWTVVAGGVEQAATGAVRLASNLVSSSSVSDTAQNNATASVFQNVTQTVTSAAAGTAQAVTNVAGTVIEGTAGIAGDIKSVWSWGSWGFRLLPAKMQVTLGLTAVIGGFLLIRSFRSHSVSLQHTTNVNINNMPRECKLVTTKTGTTTTVSLDCTPAPVPAPITSKDIPNRLTLRKLHKRLEDAQKIRLLLPEDVREKLAQLRAELDKAKGTYYRGVDISGLIARAKAVDAEVADSAETHILRVIETWRAKK